MDLFELGLFLVGHIFVLGWPSLKHNFYPSFPLLAQLLLSSR